LLNALFTSIDMYFVINGTKYWVVAGPSGLMVYVKEGSRTRYLGYKSLAEVKEMLAKADAEVVQKIKTELEVIKQAVDSRKTAAQTPQTAQTPSLTWKKDDHTYWLVLYAKTVYIYMKGPETRHRPKLVEKTDINGLVGRVVAAGALHVLEALSALVNGLYSAAADMLKQAEKTPDGGAHREAPHREAQVSRREAEAALRELRRELSRAVKRWDEEWRMKTGLEGPDAQWLRKKLRDFVGSYIHLLEKIQPYEDLLDKLADAAAEATAGHLTRSDALEILRP
jgi:hypothetical protein